MLGLQNASSTGSEFRARVAGVVRVVAGPLGLSLLCAIVCRWAAGDQLGLYLGGVFAMTLLAPPLMAGEETWGNRAIVFGAIVAGIGAVWLAAVFAGDVVFIGWLRSVLVLVAYGLAISALASALRAVRVAAAPAGAVATAAGLVWLAWPVWLCPWLGGASRNALVNALVAGHPAMVINGALRDTYGMWWGHHKLAYQLANILNDIPYELPQSVWIGMLVHLALAGILIAMAVLAARMRRSATPLPAHQPADR